MYSTGPRWTHGGASERTRGVGATLAVDAALQSQPSPILADHSQTVAAGFCLEGGMMGELELRSREMLMLLGSVVLIAMVVMGVLN